MKLNYYIITTCLIWSFSFSQNTIEKPKVSFSFDDPTIKDLASYKNEIWNKMILKTLKKHKVQSTLFVCGMRIDNPEGMALLKLWDKDGHKIGNHSYKHYNFSSKRETSSVENFKKDFLKTDSIIKNFKNYSKYYRFPYLKEGNTKEKIEGFRNFIKENGYKNGYVSIDASDWYINNRLIDTLKINPNKNLNGYRDFYIQHLYERAVFYNNLGKELGKSDIKHVLLLHHNLTSALFLDDLINHFKKMGWEIISTEEAYKDSIYQELPSIIPAGESIIWAKAKENGNFESILRYPAEDSIYEKEIMDSLKL